MARINTYVVGEPVELTAVVTVDDSPATPDTTTFKVKKPDDTLEELGSGSEAPTGTFTATYDAPDLEGDYWWSFTGTGAAQGYAEKMFTVTEKRVVA